MSDVTMRKAYISSLKNEIEVEKFFYRKLKASPQDYSYAPRITKLLGFNKLFPIRLFFFVISKMWSLVIYPIYVFIQFIFIFLKKISTLKFGCIDVSDISGVILVPSDERAISTIITRERLAKDGLIVFTSRLKIPNNLRLKALSTVDMLSLKEIVCCLIDSLSLMRMLNKKDNRLSNWILQTYVTFDWVILYRTMDKIARNGQCKDYFIVDHFDRWAILMDTIAGIDVNSKLNVVQHGIIHEVNNKGQIQFPFDFNYKLKNVSCLYAFDAISESVFRKHILHETLSLDKVFYGMGGIEVKSVVDDPATKVVLFVGHSLCEELHLSVNSLLQGEKRIFSIYKPHPNQVVGFLIKQGSWLIFSENEYFPQADVVVSYPSTLAVEYSQIGTDIVMHQLDDVNYNNIVEQVLDILDK